MLRLLIVVFAIALTAVGLVLVALGIPFPGWHMLVLGLLLLLGTVFERRYRGASGSSTTDWENTGERFIDPTTGEALEVQFDRRTGERRYVTRSEA